MNILCLRRNGVTRDRRENFSKRIVTHTTNLYTKYDFSDQIKKAETGGRWQRRENFYFESLKERDHLRYVRIHVRIILKWLLRTIWEGVDWINIVQGKDRWQAFVKRQWFFGFHGIHGFSWLDELLLASQEELYTMELFAAWKASSDWKKVSWAELCGMVAPDLEREERRCLDQYSQAPWIIYNSRPWPSVWSVSHSLPHFHTHSLTV